VVLEGLVRLHSAQQDTSSGLLLLAILLSAADPPVRLAFLAGVPGEVLLRLLAEVAAADEGDKTGSSAHPTPQNRACSFKQWQAHQPGASGALDLTGALAQVAGRVSDVPSRQAVLQVLLWCFFEVVPPRQHQQQEEEEEEQQQQHEEGLQQGAACSSGSCSGGGVQCGMQAQQLLAAAQRGMLWAPSTGEGQPTMGMLKDLLVQPHTFLLLA
jgi:hypothetical protein